MNLSTKFYFEAQNRFSDKILLISNLSSGVNEHLIGSNRKISNIIFFTESDNPIDTNYIYPTKDYVIPIPEYKELEKNETFTFIVSLNSYFDQELFSKAYRGKNVKALITVYFLVDGELKREQREFFVFRSMK